jgi:hypothetical protein
MIPDMSSATFDALIIGTQELLVQSRPHPLPALFQRVCHLLSLYLKGTYPRTHAGLLRLFERPVGEWWPIGLPAEYDAAFGILDDGRLSEEASQYFFTQLLEQAQLPRDAGPLMKQIVLDNRQFKLLIEQLQEKYQHDPEYAQREYVKLRRFLIEHPYTTSANLRANFRSTRYISAVDVGRLYDRDLLEGLLIWNCTECGPLTMKQHNLRGIKPSICNDHRPFLAHIQQIPWERGLRRIIPGIHWRVCLPGIPELKLLDALIVIQSQYPKYLCAIDLWPGLDRYDLRLRFADEAIWAIDVKDHTSPHRLARHLTRIYAEGALRYDQGFYVVPRRCLKHDQYLQIAREEATSLPRETHLLSDTMFEGRVLSHITQLAQKEV